MNTEAAEKKKSAVILIPNTETARFDEIVKRVGIREFDFQFAETKEELTNIFETNNTIDLLLSFGTSIIVPGVYLERTGLIAANIHAASASFPGRDPHHYAIYEAVPEYGATLHFMTEKVDDGPIIAIKTFSVSGCDTPISLLEKANEFGWQLVEQLLVWLKDGVMLIPSVHVWSGTKRSRKDFQNFCRIDIDISKEELERRIRSFHVDKFQNIFVEIQGKKFYYNP